MKEKFPGFYGIDETREKEIWSAKNTVFIFDTNALLTLYRCEKNTRDVFFSRWEEIKEKVWLPFHICLEFQRNRLNAIKAHVTELDNVGNETKSRVINAVNPEAFDKKFIETIKRYPELQSEFEVMRNEFEERITNFVENNINNRINEADFFTHHDTIRDKIEVLTGDRTGNEPSGEHIKQLSESGLKRYKNKIPPGFEDEKEKKEDTFHYKGTEYFSKFGDWYIWSEILELVARDKKEGVIFVSNDLKEDWIYRVAGKKRGPLESLRTELSEKGGGTSLLLYSTSGFLEKSNYHLSGDKVDKQTIQKMKLAEDSTSRHLSAHRKKSEDESDFVDLYFVYNKEELPTLKSEALDAWINIVLTGISYRKGLELIRRQMSEFDKVISQSGVPQVRKIRFTLASLKLKEIESNLLSQLGEPEEF
ncbi:PIN-like domain-containing protein [Erwinia mallotivora]|uniref:PIN-like domain-containing protein n=1 Tax=Erwinia mallotivora TaxID=69222 RepID=UPI0021C1058A|nr:PIN-like domain-containing protein [Erwinia mallotivora]